MEYILNGNLEDYTMTGNSFFPTTSLPCTTIFGIFNTDGQHLAHGALNTWEEGTGRLFANSTPDYFNVYGWGGNNIGGAPCNWQGTQVPKSGNGMCGILTSKEHSGNSLREYIKQEFLTNSTLSQGWYFIIFWASLAENSSRCTRIGAVLSDKELEIDQTNSAVIPPNPYYYPILESINKPAIISPGYVDELSDDQWMPIFGIVRANGDEKWITIGNFEIDPDPISQLPNYSPTNPILGCTNSWTAGDCDVQFFQGVVNDEKTIEQSYYYLDEISLKPLEGRIFIQATVKNKCDGSVWELSVPNANQYNQILWSNGATTNPIEVDINAQTEIRVAAFGSSGCPYYGNIVLDPTSFVTIETQSLVQICSGESVELNANGAQSYSWSPGSYTTQLITVSPTVTTIYTVTGTCSGNITSTATVTVEVREPNSQLTVTSNLSTLCPGVIPVNIIASGSSNGYTWTPTTYLNTNTLNQPIVQIVTLPSGSITYTVSGRSLNDCPISANIAFDYLSDCGDNVDCAECIPSFSPIAGQKYIISAWVKEEQVAGKNEFKDPLIKLTFSSTSTRFEFEPKGNIIDGWQKIEEEFEIPNAASALNIDIQNTGADNIYIDDVRIYPKEGKLQTYVFDPISLRLMAVLDENNYATLYEYDEEGNLLRVKKETERGVFTLKESRESKFKKQTD